MSGLAKRPRVKLPILKGTVIDRTNAGFTIQFGGFRVIAQCAMSALDIRDGDQLTAYVEVLITPPTPTPSMEPQ